MTTPIEVIYERGVLRPLKPIELPEGECLEIILLKRDRPQTGNTPAAILAEIAALPEEGPADSFSGQDHDRILYGNRP